MRLLRSECSASDAIFFARMYICYLDESGTAEASGNTDHFVLLGMAIPADSWRVKDEQVMAIKAKYGLQNAEVHTAWMLREYPEQRYVTGFEAMDHASRRKAVLIARTFNASSTTRTKSKSLLKNYVKTQPYVHLTRAERTACVKELAQLVGNWQDVRMFADAQAKKHAPGTDHFAFAFEQVVTRFNTFLRKKDSLGLLVQDNNETECKRLTAAMRKFHKNGTMFTQVKQLVETPLFVDSSLTAMIQLADICAYATRRYFDNGETDLFKDISPAFDRSNTSCGISRLSSNAPVTSASSMGVRFSR